MIHTSKNQIRIILIVFSVCIVGCKKFVQTDPPSTIIVTASVFTDAGAAHSALIQIYSQMAQNSESFNMSFHNGLLSDELINVSDVFHTTFYQDALSSYSTTYLFWTRAYNYIYQANAVIEGLSNYSGVSPAIKSQLTGEAKFIRAFWYFYLVNGYGDVPLATTTDYKVNALLPRAPKDQVYNQVKADLIAAESLLNTDYVDQTDTSVTTQRARPTKAAAMALLARTYLYTNRYDSAEQLSSAVINNPRFVLSQDLNSVFLADNAEAIWQIAIPTPDGGLQTSDGTSYILISGPNTNNNLITPWLLNSFELGDLRKSSWIGSYTDGTTTWYFPYKYQVYDDTHNPNSRQEDYMMLRLAEQYLIRAEARAQLNQTSGALDDLNTIRHRAGLGDYAGGTDQASLLTAILHERQVELFTEWGHRWFDLIRTGNINAVMGAPGNIGQQKGGTWDASGYQALYPILRDEIVKDPNLTQNPRY